MPSYRYEAEDGSIWDSKYEYAVYRELYRVLGSNVRSCVSGSNDSVAYTSGVRKARCMECQSTNVVQDRRYTPDFFISTPCAGDEHRGYFVESKGLWRAPKRRVFRDASREYGDASLVFVFQHDAWVTKGKTRYSDYMDRYCKNIPYLFWNGRTDDLLERIEEARSQWLER